MNIATLDATTLIGGSFLFCAAWYWTFYGITLSLRAFRAGAGMGEM